MNGNKIILILIALTSMMLWTMPSTVSVFSSGHAFYGNDGINVQCIKCHTDIRNQLEDTGSVNAIHRNLDTGYGCKSCHSNPNNTIGRNATEDYHSSYSPYCIECHPNTTTIYGDKESHTIIVTSANASTMKLGINEACILCHTTMVQEITIRNRIVFAFESDSVAVNGTPEYDGTYTTTISNPEPTGLHNYISGVTCISCHFPVYEIMSRPIEPYQTHNEFGCTGCHRERNEKDKKDKKNTKGTEKNTKGTEKNMITYHAAKTRYCSDCHGQVYYPRDCNQCHDSHGGFK